MKRLYLDTATSGKMLFREPVTHARQPHMARLALLEVTDGRERHFCQLVKPEFGWPWDDDATVGHGITAERAQANGYPLKRIMATLQQLLDASPDEVIAYNLSFHLRVLQRSAFDIGKTFALPPGVNGFDAMREATDIVRKPRGDGSFMWPKQTEAFAFFSDGAELPPLELDPIQRGLALVRSVRTIHEGILAHRSLA